MHFEIIETETCESIYRNVRTNERIERNFYETEKIAAEHYERMKKRLQEYSDAKPESAALKYTNEIRLVRRDDSDSEFDCTMQYDYYEYEY